MIVYEGAKNLSHLLEKEIKGIKTHYGDLFISEEPLQKVYWAQNVWLNSEIIYIKSITDAVSKLRKIKKYWQGTPFKLYRRSELIQKELPKCPTLSFPTVLPSVGAWCLIDENRLIASPNCTHPSLKFNENKKEPPSRAYLKLWELFTLFKVHPEKGESCLEIGAAPGGWSWVLKELGAKVTAIDRAPLADPLMSSPNITFLKGDAFKLDPLKFAPFDWIFSDAICYPDKLFSFVEKWLAVLDANFVCTIKFQGEEHYSWIEKFAAIKNSQIVHLHQNKHELTWVRIR